MQIKEAYQPIQTEAAFDKAMAAFGFCGKSSERVAVAVSGGADSMALFRLLLGYSEKSGIKLSVFTVDHGLRPESAAEARFVFDEAKRMGVPCRILKWAGDKPLSGIEKTAREARYGLLFSACREEGIKSLFLGHHRQDQAETFLLRRAAHSGALGLAGMSAVRSFAFGRMYRPLLGISPSELRAYDRSLGQTWVEDPTNASDCFERGRIRQTASSDVLEDAFFQSLKYGALRMETERQRTEFLNANAQVFDKGYVLMSRAGFLDAKRETAVGSMGEVLRAVANKAYVPKEDSLERLYENIKRSDFKGCSLGGCRIAPSAKGRLLIWREYADLPPPLRTGSERLFYWDRFAFELSQSTEGLVVKALEGRLKELWRAPKRCFFVLPALFDREGLFLVPHLGYKKTDVSCRADFAPIYPLCKSPEWMLPVT